jgi:hypothetical protein
MPPGRDRVLALPGRQVTENTSFDVDFRRHRPLSRCDRSSTSGFRRGASPETICQNFETLCLEEVTGAVAYYLANQTEVDAYLIRQDERWAEGRRKAEPLPANLRERLTRARDKLHTSSPS